MTQAPSDHITDADRDDIQGNLVGFNKDFVRLQFVQFPDAASGRAFLAAMGREVIGASDVLDINRDAKRLAHEGKDPTTLSAVETNVTLTFAGLTVIGAPGLDGFPQEFAQGMRARADLLGDVDGSAPSNWAPPFDGATPIHAMVINAADNVPLLDQRASDIAAAAQTAHAVIVGAQDGHTRPGDQRGHEHFGFKDGISQPSIASLTRSSKGGEDIAAGEFLIGYPDQDGNISGTPPAGPPPTPGQPGYNPVAPPPPPQPMPDWARNGSFVVYRRLRQDVQGFRGFVAAQASAAGLTPDQLAAKLVGRWPSGAPMEHVPGLPPTVDASTADPSVAHPAVCRDEHINAFAYAGRDPDGHAVPRAAHIRKAYPRDEALPGGDDADRHRIARRGIPYGPEFAPGEPAYPGAGPVPDNQDRGLLFICYQSSIARGFEFIQTQWANQPDFPQPGDGQDPIISQNRDGAPFAIPPNAHLALQRWVTTVGGDYFFAPSISALAHLAQQQQ